MQVEIGYHALLREERGCSREILEIEPSTYGELYTDLAKKFHFSLPKERLRVAANDTFVAWDTPVQANDRIVFVPPVAGG